MVDIRYSQNFYKNANHLKEMIKNASFSPNDIVLDIGAGNGVIAQELSKYTDNVTAFELDSRYFRELTENLSSLPIKFLNDDFLLTKLPTKDFKIFSNIPFALTSEIINKITAIDSSLVEAYLFVQQEAADRFLGTPFNTQIATILGSRYTFSIVEELDRYDFNPVPSVDVVLLRIVKKRNPEIEFELYRDFVSYIFNQTNKLVIDTLKKIFTEKQMKYIKKYLFENGYDTPSEIPLGYYLEVFQYFKMNGDDYKKKVRGYYQRYTEQHSKREKVNRTRI